jgi:hypothetical protein
MDAAMRTMDTKETGERAMDTIKTRRAMRSVDTERARNAKSRGSLGLRLYRPCLHILVGRPGRERRGARYHRRERLGVAAEVGGEVRLGLIRRRRLLLGGCFLKLGLGIYVKSFILPVVLVCWALARSRRGGLGAGSSTGLVGVATAGLHFARGSVCLGGLM